MPKKTAKSPAKQEPVRATRAKSAKPEPAPKRGKSAPAKAPAKSKAAKKSEKSPAKSLSKSVDKSQSRSPAARNKSASKIADKKTMKVKPAAALVLRDKDQLLAIIEMSDDQKFAQFTIVKVSRTGYRRVLPTSKILMSCLEQI
jgi:hypothetical protein